jgi:hypothetical protein
MQKQKLEDIRILLPVVVVTILVIISFVYLFRELALSGPEFKIFGVSVFSMTILIGINIYFMVIIYKVFQKNSISIEKIHSRITTNCPFKDITISKNVPGHDAFCQGCFLSDRNQCKVREEYKKLNP